jgi:hypothetical protein
VEGMRFSSAGDSGGQLGRLRLRPVDAGRGGPGGEAVCLDRSPGSPSCMPWLLLVVLTVSIVFAGIARENHRAKRQTRLINDLAQNDVRVRASEPTGLALLARKMLGRRDVWLVQRMDESWFSRPRELVTWTATDEQIPHLVDRIEQLDAVRELHLEQSPVTERGIAALKSDLPGVAVLTRTDLVTRGTARPKEHFATAAVQLVAIAGAGVFGITIVLAWPFIRWRRKRRLSRAPSKPS